MWILWLALVRVEQNAKILSFFPAPLAQGLNTDVPLNPKSKALCWLKVNLF
jgi:hypothetical protein